MCSWMVPNTFIRWPGRRRLELVESVFTVSSEQIDSVGIGICVICVKVADESSDAFFDCHSRPATYHGHTSSPSSPEILRVPYEPFVPRRITIGSSTAPP